MRSRWRRARGRRTRIGEVGSVRPSLIAPPVARLHAPLTASHSVRRNLAQCPVHVIWSCDRWIALSILPSLCASLANATASSQLVASHLAIRLTPLSSALESPSLTMVKPLASRRSASVTDTNGSGVAAPASTGPMMMTGPGPHHAMPPNPQQAMMHQQMQAQANELAKRRSRKPTDKNLPDGVEDCTIGDVAARYRDLRDFERRLDATITRKRLDIVDSATKTGKVCIRATRDWLWTRNYGWG